MFALQILALAFAVSAPASPPDDAEAYRLDALQTRALNKRALSRIKPRTTAPAAIARPPARMPVSRDERLRRGLEDAVQRWRDRVAACRAGDEPSCDR